MQIASSVFQSNGDIPQKYTCDGDYFNPPLIFQDIPGGSVSLALLVEDLDAPAGLWVHWLVWNIPPSVLSIAENSIPQGIVGKNSSQKNSWDDICPPNGEHRYFFRLFALDTMLKLDPLVTTRKEFLEAIKSHVIEKAELMGKYKRLEG